MWTSSSISCPQVEGRSQGKAFGATSLQIRQPHRHGRKIPPSSFFLQANIPPRSSQAFRIYCNFLLQGSFVTCCSVSIEEGHDEARCLDASELAECAAVS